MAMHGKRMNHSKSVPDRLKPQECERNTWGSKLPILHNPENNIIQDEVDAAGNTLKLTLSHKVDLHVPVQSKGLPNYFGALPVNPWCH